MFFMKKKSIVICVITGIIFLIIGGICLIKYYKIKNAVINVSLIKKLETEFLSDVKVSDFITDINGTIIDDYKINTKKLGKRKVSFKYINEDNIELSYSYNLKIVDTSPPVIWLNDNYTVLLGSEDRLTKDILCGDNYDSKPICEIIGDYDINKLNSYPLVFRATDSSGNISEKNFNLNVVAPSNSNVNNYTNSKTFFSDIVKKYKNRNTEIGLDISHWQGDIDFDKLKNAGVEFVMIRVGRTDGIGGKYVLDTKFERNIKEANRVGIPVGVYFYSYANSDDSAKSDAKWVLNKIKNYKVELPVAFDWENWNSYNEFNLSFFGLTEIANSFLDVFKNAGYEGLLYSSKNYLEKIWLKTDYPIWLAHYTENTTYQGNYNFWQICSDGIVDGINASVDINIRYK